MSDWYKSLASSPNGADSPETLETFPAPNLLATGELFEGEFSPNDHQDVPLGTPPTLQTPPPSPPLLTNRLSTGELFEGEFNPGVQAEVDGHP